MSRLRLWLVVVAFVAWGGLVGWRLWMVQLEGHEAYAARARAQQQRSVELEPPRGEIVDARGRALAVSVEVESVYAVPSSIEDPAATVAALVPVLGSGVRRLEEKLAGEGEFLWVARQLDRPVADAVRSLGLAGIGFLRESRRYYPMGQVAAPIVGFVGTDHRGLAGVELGWDDWIAGEAGHRTVLRDAHRETVLVPGLQREEARPGGDVRLTIDAVEQEIVERALDRALEATGARRAMAVFLDPADGRVVAMATRPSFDPNHFADFEPELWRNASIMDAYEPGSTFKVFTVAAGLEAGLVGPEDRIDCEMGAIRFGKITIRDHKPFGELTLREILAKSSNVGAIKVGLKVGETRLYDMISRLGFGRVTGLGLPGESAGILHPLERWSALSKAYVSFGQEVAITPAQLARSVSAVANGGFSVTPWVIEAPRREVAGRGERVLSASTAEILREMLGQVAETGTARTAARLTPYRIGGKTGTAQVPVRGGYSRSRFIPSFVGMAPLDAPRLVGVVAVDSPTNGSYHGGDVAAPIFAQVVDEILTRRGVQPLDSGAVLPQSQPQLAGRTLPPPAEEVLPDLAGLTARQALRWAELAGLDLALDGRGWVVAQEPAAGTPRASLESVRVHLAPEVG